MLKYEVEVRSKGTSLSRQFLQLFTLHIYFPVRYSLFVIPFSGSAGTRANEQGITNNEYRIRNIEVGKWLLSGDEDQVVIKRYRPYPFIR